MTRFTTIGLIGRLDNKEARRSVERVLGFLQQQGLAVIVDEQTAALLDPQSLSKAQTQTASMTSLGERCDLAVVVGGDGSLLSAARDLTHAGVPLLGVNRGRLGFLTDILPDDIEQKMGEVLSGQFAAEERFLLDVSIMRAGKEVARADALNDVVLHPGEFIRMLGFELYVDDHFVTSQRADGMIVSTPTGSTAYALSGGGPIMHPELEAIVLVPMNPHTLSSRPIVVPAASVIKIIVGEKDTSVAHITCDGQTHDPVADGDEIIITQKPQRLQLIHPRNHNFYERCRSKLGWGGHLLER